MSTFIGLDLGTTAVKAVLIDAAQNIIGTATAEVPLVRPHPGWSEQAPADWIAAAETGLDSLAAGHDLSEVAGIGLSGHMHGATLVDKADRPLRPCIMWNDTRSH